jgi:hypothetical protein
MDISQYIHYGTCTQEIIERETKRLREVQTIRGASLESYVLAQSGTFPHPAIPGRRVTYPPCSRGECCLTYREPCSVSGLDAPIILMSSMDEKEAEHLRSRGRVPDNFIPEPCVLCYRDIYSKLILYDRRAQMTSDPPKVTRPPTESNPLTMGNAMTSVLHYRNTQDQADGYIGDFMFPFSEKEYLMQPIVMANTSRLKAFQDTKQGGRWIVDQTALIWKPPHTVVAEVGETAMSF